MQSYKAMVAQVGLLNTEWGFPRLGSQGGESEAGVESSVDHIRAQEAGGNIGGMRGLERRLKESDTMISNLERELRKVKLEKKDYTCELRQRVENANAMNTDLERKLLELKHEMLILKDVYRDALARLAKGGNWGKKYRDFCENYSKLYSHANAERWELYVKNDEITKMNSHQDREMQHLRNANLNLTGELEKRVEQLNTLTADIARQNQHMNTSAIRDDEYFAREFASLAKHIRNWSFTHLFHRSETFVPQAVTGDLEDAIREVASGTNLHEIFENRAASRRVVSGLLANRLRKQLFDPLLLGLLPQMFLEFENSIDKKSGAQRSPWLSQTISLLVKTQEFERSMDEKVHIESKYLSEMLEGLAPLGSDGSKASKRSQKLHTIVERAANLALEVSQQPYRFRFMTITPGESFDPHSMEDVNTDPSLSEDDAGSCGAYGGVSLSVFPLVYREQQVERGTKLDTILINRAWVTVETRERELDAEPEDDDISNREANGGDKFEVKWSSGKSGRRREMGAHRKGSWNSPYSSIWGSENSVSVGLISLNDRLARLRL